MAVEDIPSNPQYSEPRAHALLLHISQIYSTLCGVHVNPCITIATLPSYVNPIRVDSYASIHNCKILIRIKGYISNHGDFYLMCMSTQPCGITKAGLDFGVWKLDPPYV
jgi:hypothetical protein